MYKNILAILAVTIISVNSFSQSKITREEYIATYADLAVREMNRSGIPASITLAQGCLESGNGNSKLSRKSNNHFGIKCKKDWKGKRVYHDDDRKNECFRHYRTVEDSYIDHSDFLMENPRYASLFDLKITDYKGWARGLKRAGYATAPHYASELIRIIEENKLYLYDQGLNRSQLAKLKKNGFDGHQVDNGTLVNPYTKRKVVYRNGLKSIVVKAGDSFKTIAQEFDMKTWEVYTYNDYPINHPIKVNEILYIQPKRTKGTKKQITHRLQADESMHYISQRYGIKLKPLMKRNRLKKNEKPVPGTTIYLRKKKPKS